MTLKKLFRVTPRRNDPEVWRSLVSSIKTLSKAVNEVIMGILPLMKLYEQKPAPRVAARRLLAACGVSSSPDKLADNLPEFFKRAFVDTLPANTGDICRVGLNDMTFGQLVEKAADCYKRDPEQNPFAAFGINAVSAYKGGQSNSNKRGRGGYRSRDQGRDISRPAPRSDQTGLDDRLSRVEKALNHISGKLGDNERKHNGKTNEPFICFLHKKFGERAHHCRYPGRCQFYEVHGTNGERTNFATTSSKNFL